jgi:hypothetical protein
VGPGGALAGPEIEQAAVVAYAGLDANAFLRCDDPLELMVTLAVTKRLVEMRQRRDRDLAQLIANAVGRMLGG